MNNTARFYINSTYKQNSFISTCIQLVFHFVHYYGRGGL